MSDNEIIHLTTQQVIPASTTLTQSLFHYPLFVSFIPDEAERDEKLHLLFDFMIRFAIRYGEVHTTSLNYEAVALWLPSENADYAFSKMLRVGGLTLMYNYLRHYSVISRLMEYNEYAFNVHHLHASSTHWYLTLLGTQPTYQGQGFASQLMRYMLTRADKDDLPCFLETANKQSIPIYEHFGFHIVEESTVPHTSVYHCAMVRTLAS